MEEAASPPAIIEESRKACSCYQPVEFAYAQVHLRSDVRAILDSAAQTLAANPEVKVTIVGHSDAIGSARYNYRLSLRRAQVVKAYPVSKGVTASRLETVAKGEKAPLAPNTKNGKVNPGGRAINRRIELRVR